MGHREQAARALSLSFSQRGGNMTIYAWVQDGVIRDISKKGPEKVFTPEVAALYDQQVPDKVKPGDLWDGTTWTPAADILPVPIVIPPVRPTVSLLDFTFLFTAAEFKAIRANKTEAIEQSVLRLESPQASFIDLGKPYVLVYLEALVAASILTNARVSKILTGKFPSEV